MKYTITLTAENLSFVETLTDHRIAALTKMMHDKMNGKEVVIFPVDEEMDRDWAKFEKLFKPIKQQADGTPLVTAKVCELLNRRLGLEGRKGYKPTTMSTKKLISARINEGYELEDFLEVIEKKCGEWVDTEQEKYLRPETLFGNKFAGYLAQKETISHTPTTEQQRSTDYSEGL